MFDVSAKVVEDDESLQFLGGKFFVQDFLYPVSYLLSSLVHEGKKQEML